MANRTKKQFSRKEALGIFLLMTGALVYLKFFYGIDTPQEFIIAFLFVAAALVMVGKMISPDR